MYWMGSAPRKPNSGHATAGWKPGRKASQPQTSANSTLVMPAEAKVLTPTRRKALATTPLRAKPSVMTRRRGELDVGAHLLVGEAADVAQPRARSTG